jgi:flagellar protein FliS
MSLNRPGAGTTRPVDRFHADGDGAVSQGRLLVLLYERLLRDLDDAVVGIAARDRERAHRSLVHAQDIVSELDLALDHERWPGAAQQSAIYRFLLQQLVRANIDQDAQLVRECRAVVAPLAETWTEAWKQTSSAPTPTPIPATVGPAAERVVGAAAAAPGDRAPLDVVG